MKKAVSIMICIVVLFSLFAFTIASADSYATVTGGWLRLRSAPSLSAATLASYYTGTVVQLLGPLQNGWYHVRVSDGSTGYMSAAYLVTGSSPSPSPVGTTAYVTSQNGYGVRLRQGPGTGYRVIRTYPVGTKVTVLSAGSYWSRININGTVGYMMSQFLSSSISPSPVIGYATVWSSNGYGVRLRQGPGTNFSVIGKYSVGTQVSILEKGPVWDKIMVGSRVGYMMNQFLIHYSNNELTSVTLNSLTPSVNDVLFVSSINPSGATVNYQWLVDGMVKGTSSTYTVTTGDVGLRIQLMVTGTGNYKGTVTSAKTNPVTAEKVLKGVELDNYAPEVGDVIKATLTPSNADVIYAWVVGTQQKSNAATYTVKPEDVGLCIRLVATGRNDYTGTCVSYTTNPVKDKTVNYTVSFNSCGYGVAPADQIVQKGNKAVDPGPLTAIGQIFTGWWLNSSTKFDFNTPITADTVLYAGWMPQATTHIVTFHSNGHGTAPGEQYVVDGQCAANPGSLTAEHYLFTGWWKADSTKFDFSTPINADLDLYAGWMPVGTSYTVTFNSNGHGTAPSAQTVAENTCAINPGSLTAEGYTFTGWWTESSALFDFSTPITADLTLYAGWTAAPVTYTVTFNSNGHGTAPGAQTVAENACAINPGNLTAEGYTFTGWWTESSLFFDFSTPITADITLYAGWVPAPVTYTVTFNSNGHGTAPGAQTVMENTCAIDPGSLTAEGYTFTGWWTESSSLFDFSTPITADITLYAGWTAAPVSYTVTFNSNGHGTAPGAQTVTENTCVSNPGSLTAEGYTFTGWWTESSALFDFSTPITADITLYAGWTVVPSFYTVTFNSNGHGTSPSAQTIAENACAIDPGSLTEEGYTFTGWWTESSALFDFSTPITADITLYAGWAANP